MFACVLLVTCMYTYVGMYIMSYATLWGMLRVALTGTTYFFRKSKKKKGKQIFSLMGRILFFLSLSLSCSALAGDSY